MAITNIPSTRPGNGNPGIVPPWLISPIKARTNTVELDATTWDPQPVDHMTDMPRLIERPIHTWPHDGGETGRPRVV